MPAVDTGSPSAERQPDSIVAALLSISKTARQLVGIRLAECDVMPGQDQFLLCLTDRDGLSIADIAARLSIRPSTVSKMTDNLAAKGWMTRGGDETDQRLVRVWLSKSGRRAAEAVRGIEAALEVELLAALGRDASILPTLAKLDAVLAKRLSRLR
jgi:DNA-binding MarR family transcriptional regulator